MAYLLNTNEEWDLIQNQIWLKFQSNDRKFYGTPTEANYKQTFTIKVVATDGYSMNEDIFVLKVDKLPFMYVVNYIVSIAGMLVSILGVWKNKQYIMGLLCKKQYYYSPKRLWSERTL